MTKDLEPISASKIQLRVDRFSVGLTKYLERLGLPAEDVLVQVAERATVIDTLPAVIQRLTLPQRQAAMYISKFTAACGAGLFDAALNYLWDETIRSLRDKVNRFDLEYFYDTAVPDQSQRQRFKDAEDLERLEDWILVKSCRDTGIISDIAFRHLDFIRDMRNWASAAHPNQNTLTGLQLAAWLETCIKEVIGRDPEGPAVEVRKLLRSLRSEVWNAAHVPPIGAAIARLPQDLASSLLRAAFGMFCDARQPASVRTNIQLIAQSLWSAAADDVRFETALKQASLAANGEIARAKLAREFLECVDGLAFLPSDTRAVEIGQALEALWTAHNGFGNFANEASPAASLRRLIPASGDVPKAVLARYVKILTLCAVGNGYGVSWQAEPVYTALIATWQADHMVTFISLLADSEVSSRVQSEKCAVGYQRLCNRLRDRATNAVVRDVLQSLATLPVTALSRSGENGPVHRALQRLRIPVSRRP